MTDARDIYARTWGRSHLFDWEGQCEDPRNDWQYYVDSICAALNLSPSAASALMDGTATVVPMKLSPEMLEAADEANSDDWTAETDPMFISETTRRIYSAAVAASPYRRKDDGT